MHFQTTSFQSENWASLNDDQKFKSFMDFFDTNNRRLSFEMFKYGSVHELAAMRRVIQPKLDLLTAQGAVYPEQLFWIESIPANDRKVEEQKFKDKYENGFFNAYKSFFARDFIHLSESDKLKYLSVPGRALVPEESQWLLTQSHEKLNSIVIAKMWQYLPWSSLPEAVKYGQFLNRFNYQRIAPSLHIFKKALIDKLPEMRAGFKPFFDEFYESRGASREQLFFIENVPRDRRTTFEKGYINNYGFGYFDTYDSFSIPDIALPFKDRTIFDQAFQNQFLGHNPHRIKIVKKDLQKIFNEAEVESATVAMGNLQPWLISYFYINSGSLTAKQKSWGLSQLGRLHSPEGIEAYQALLLQIVMQTRKKSL